MTSTKSVLLPSDLVDSEKQTGELCRICRMRPSRYTCPTCIAGYCSLECFRSQSHNQCSENFYRKELVSDVKAAPDATNEERLQMMDLLKRFEEDALENDLDPLSSNVEDAERGDDLAQRLAGVQLDSASPEQLWAALTPEERKKFLHALDNPDSDLAQRLLASEELERERCEPWWEAPPLGDEELDTSAKRYRTEPPILIVPPSMIKPVSRGPTLIYNLSAILIAYAYVTRHLCISPLAGPSIDGLDLQEARRQISRIVPFLVDRRAKVAFPSLSNAVTDIWSRLDVVTTDAGLFSILLRDTAALVRPLAVTPCPANDDHTPLESHPQRLTLLAISDLIQLFESYQGDSNAEIRPSSNHITFKLTFYAAHVLSTPSHRLAALAEEFLDLSRHLQTEAGTRSSGKKTEKP